MFVLGVLGMRQSGAHTLALLARGGDQRGGEKRRSHIVVILLRASRRPHVHTIVYVHMDVLRFCGEHTEVVVEEEAQVEGAQEGRSVEEEEEEEERACLRACCLPLTARCSK